MSTDAKKPAAENKSVTFNKPQKSEEWNNIIGDATRISDPKTGQFILDDGRYIIGCNRGGKLQVTLTEQARSGATTAMVKGAVADVLSTTTFVDPKAFDMGHLYKLAA